MKHVSIITISLINWYIKYIYILYLLVILNNKLYLFYECQGWHLLILIIARYVPLKTPKRRITSIAYWEHVGVNLQLGGNIGDIKYL